MCSAVFGSLKIICGRLPLAPFFKLPNYTVVSVQVWESLGMHTGSTLSGCLASFWEQAQISSDFFGDLWKDFQRKLWKV
jgi:hypothetical protein